MKDDTKPKEKTKAKRITTPETDLEKAIQTYFRVVAFRAAEKKMAGALPAIMLIRHFAQSTNAYTLRGGKLANHPNMLPTLGTIRLGKLSKRFVFVGALYARIVCEKALLKIGD